MARISELSASPLTVCLITCLMLWLGFRGSLRRSSSPLSHVSRRLSVPVPILRGRHCMLSIFSDTPRDSLPDCVAPLLPSHDS
nr:hypothetical protein CFP56_00887 [Quercus suber]